MTLPPSFRLTPVRLMATIAAAAVVGGAALVASAAGDPLAGVPAALSSAAVPPAAGPGAMPGHGHGHGPGLPGLMLPRGPMLDHLLDRIDATAAQRSRVRDIVDAAAASMQADGAAARADHAQLMQLFTQATVDAAAVEALRQRELARHEAATRIGMQALLDVGQVLGADQRVRLQGLMADMHAHRHPPAGDVPADSSVMR